MVKVIFRFYGTNPKVKNAIAEYGIANFSESYFPYIANQAVIYGAIAKAHSFEIWVKKPGRYNPKQLLTREWGDKLYYQYILQCLETTKTYLWGV